MKVKEGDVIGTVDGRYGVVDFLVTQERFLVNELFYALEPSPKEPVQFWTGISNVASVV